MPVPAAAYRKFVDAHGANIDVRRRDDTTSSQYGTGLSYSDLGERRILVAGFEESNQQVASGERQTERMTIYAHSETDLEVNDRMTIGSEEYEIVSQEELRKTSPAVTRYELDNEF